MIVSLMPAIVISLASGGYPFLLSVFTLIYKYVRMKDLVAVGSYTMSCLHTITIIHTYKLWKDTIKGTCMRKDARHLYSEKNENL